MNKKVLLSSGGMDSFLLAHTEELRGAVHVFVDVGQKYAGKEWEAARFVARSCGAQLHHVTASQFAQYEHSTGIIPLRNAELILNAAQYGNHIYLGVIADEVNSDKSPEFLAAMKQVLDISCRTQYWTEGTTYELLTPYREHTKTQLVEQYLANGGSLDMLLQSVSCYSATESHCGQCSSCFKRWVALTNATGNPDAQYFIHHPQRMMTREQWADKLKGYPRNRVEEVFRALDIAGV